MILFQIGRYLVRDSLAIDATYRPGHLLHVIVMKVFKVINIILDGLNSNVGRCLRKLF
jgi:hypothetical protein